MGDMWSRRSVRVGLAVLAVLVLLLGMAWAFQRELIYHPDTTAPSVPASATQVRMPTSDGLELTGWRFPPTAADRDAAVLVTNGNAGNRLGRVDLARSLAAKGFTVLVFDYRGYGGNPGSPDETGLYTDARAALRHLTEAGFARDRIVYFGESIGAAVATRLATEQPPAAMVLRSPFTSLADVGRHHFPFLPVRMLLTENYPVESDIADYPGRLLVAWGSHDSIVPAEQSRRVAGAAHAATVETLVLDGADHNDPVLCCGTELLDAVADLADGAGLTAA